MVVNQILILGDLILKLNLMVMEKPCPIAPSFARVLFPFVPDRTVAI